jgi:hypothetical protein
MIHLYFLNEEISNFLSEMFLAKFVCYKGDFGFQMNKFYVFQQLFFLFLGFIMYTELQEALAYIVMWCASETKSPLSLKQTCYCIMWINVREYRKGNLKWTIQRIWLHLVHKTKKNKRKLAYIVMWCASEKLHL